ncbi:RNA polymerase sigma factor SigX [Desulfosporosinus youngiae]|uniref:RNA polymerase sigma factor SigX n=1 Tax=Desulfosporosinus youngiae TaxID=339862 RepID=UPI00249DF2DB|nr:RNA polymerase sigma factor SigX [Desulfosporosinus youngiae]
MFSSFFKKEQERVPDDFNTSYEKYYPVIFRHCAYLTGDVKAAEDIAQETFIKLYNSPPAHDNTGAWLSKVATNLAYNYIRDQKTRRSKEPVIEGHMVSNVISIEEIAIKNSEVRLVRKLLNNLNHRDRLCLLLKFSGYKYNEIAEIAKIEKASVGKILARAQEKFKELYLKEGETL